MYLCKNGIAFILLTTRNGLLHNKRKLCTSNKAEHNQRTVTQLRFVCIKSNLLYHQTDRKRK